MKTIGIDINDTIRDNLTQFKNCYIKEIDGDFEIKIEDIKSFNLMDSFPFDTKEDFNSFKYNDCPYELYARAETTDKMIPYRLNDWLQNTMRDFDREDIPNIFMFSPFEIGLTIQATYAFLAKIGCRCREMIFPTDSHTMWNKCDIMITANPNLLQCKPDGKISIKINAPYNSGVSSDYEFDTMMDLMMDENNIISNLITDKNE